MTVIPFLLGPIFAGALIDNVNLNVWIFSKAGSLSHVARFSPCKSTVINLPVAGVALFLLGVFVKSPVPRLGSSAFRQVDWMCVGRSNMSVGRVLITSSFTEEMFSSLEPLRRSQLP